jgi:hypothetical protein
LINKLNKTFSNNFNVIGTSYITLNTDEILDRDSNFHLDIFSQYDVPSESNILTVLIPIIFEDDMGGLEYIIDNITNKYKYEIGQLVVFDSSKIQHRTMPFKIKNKKKRVLISINLSTDEDWAYHSTKNITSSQGNLFI